MFFNRIIYACLGFLIVHFTVISSLSAYSVDSVQIVQLDTLDSLSSNVQRGDLDSVVLFSARDTVLFKVPRKTMHLRGTASVSYKSQQLKAAQIDLDFNTSTMHAQGIRDPSGRLTGVPVFNDNGSEYVGESMKYNFRTKKGSVRFGETAIDGSFYYGSRINRISEEVIYVENGVFTTCDAPQPHFHFSSPKMKAIVNERIFLDPVIAYVGDIPVFILPVGLYFNTPKGHQSGLLMPNPIMTSDRGLLLQNGGFYWAASDYVDGELTADITTKGGVTFYNRWRYSLRDRFSGRLELRYGLSRFNVEQGFDENFGFFLTHNQDLRPNERVVADVSVTSANFFQNTSIAVRDRLTQNARSNVSYQRTFYNGHTVNLGYSRDQNMITGDLSESPLLSYSIPQITPFSGMFESTSWLNDIAISFRSTARYNHRQFTNPENAIERSENTIIEHRPSVTVTPKLGYFTLAPQITYSENWYTQAYSTHVSSADSTVTRLRQAGFFREYTYSAGVNASTILYGLAKPDIFGVKAIRHTLQPTLGIIWSPDQSDPSLGFFEQYISPITGVPVLTSRFSPFQGGTTLASRSQQLNMSVNLLNRLAIKVSDTDTSDKALEILTFDIGTNYNTIADSLNLGDIRLSVRSPVLTAISFNTTATFSAYEQQLVTNPLSGRSEWANVNKFLVATGAGLLRLRSMSLQLGTRFANEASGMVGSGGDEMDTSVTNGTLRERFERRINARDIPVDFFGDNTPGWSPFTSQWSIDLNASYSMTRVNPEQTMQSLVVSGRSTLRLTPTLFTSATASYDVITGTINSPIVEVNKVIHCWSLTLNWIPTGFNRGFILRFSADSDILRDLRIIKQSTPIWR